MTPLARSLVTLALVLSAPLAHAQFRDMWGTGWNNPVSASIGSSLYWKTMTMPPKQGQTAPAPSTANTPKLRTVHFIPAKNSPTPRKVAYAFPFDEATKRELASTFTQYVESFNKEVATGPDRYNVASAAAFFMGINYMVATGKEVSDKRIEALRDALQQNLMQHAEFQKKNASQRQELYETMVILALFAQQGLQEGLREGNEKEAEFFRTVARANLKEFIGATPEEMVFTNTGLTFK